MKFCYIKAEEITQFHQRNRMISDNAWNALMRIGGSSYVVAVTWARVISGKSQVPMLQLIYSTWVNHLQVYMETVGMLCECIYMGLCDFRLWVTS